MEDRDLALGQVVLEATVGVQADTQMNMELSGTAGAGRAGQRWQAGRRLVCLCHPRGRLCDHPAAHRV